MALVRYIVWSISENGLCFFSPHKRFKIFSDSSVAALEKMLIAGPKVARCAHSEVVCRWQLHKICDISLFCRVLLQNQIVDFDSLKSR